MSNPMIPDPETISDRLEQLAQYTLSERRKVYNAHVRRLTPSKELRSCA